MNNHKNFLISLLLSLLAILTSCAPAADIPQAADTAQAANATPAQVTGPQEQVSKIEGLSDVPEYSGAAYIAVNNNVPYFTDAEKTDDVFEEYSELDSLGRCGIAYANICTDLMPTEKRESISQVKPSGWHSVQYEFVNGKSLYNRCHLIGFQLAGENANEKNLITGTRYLNTEGMLPFEDMVADYVKETENHVLYRVTPVFTGDNLVSDGVLMEGWSVEDEGEGICFNVFAYNVQPGVAIDYATGDSMEDTAGTTTPEDAAVYILNTNSKKFHSAVCGSVEKISESNRKEFSGSRDELISQGYEPCGTCKP